MRVGAAVATVVLVASALASAADPKADPGGWQKAKWGMTRDQVAKAMPGLSDYEMPGAAKGQTVKRFGYGTYEVGGCIFDVEMTFDDNAFVKARMSPGDDRRAQCAGMTTEALKARYGLPTTTGPVTTRLGAATMVDEKLEWSFPKTNIRLERTTITGSPPIIYVIYSSRSRAAASKF